ncbi:phosphoenolpyruvate carboxylase [Candidatus Pelagibacter sp. RS40]|uniref:phosphoenolpyruvate carboxylase n=1 Tax=Candidatus Pelagibacter sp. RS40 TaxID=1977865 RepID=UPI000A1499C8|nr:phosphoenolpyruvate carboxylase [Candidatus Pelagibacter sp. RS40]ARJ48631.1 phosphoenolpyruvate carboxylase [Candidatus Pelagibacter sp. RS40]
MIKRDLYYERIPTKSLRDDVRLLGNILGNVIKKQEGQTFFNLVEKIRKLSKANTANIKQQDSYKKISKTLSQINPSNTYKLTRAFSHFMNFINLAESIDASRTLDEFENNKAKANKNIFIEEIFEELFKDRKISSNKIYNTAKNLNIGIVLTAHPTEVKRRTLIQKYHNITELLEQRELMKSFPSKQKIIDRKLYDEITIIWNTDDLKRTKPSPFDEARWGLAIIEDSLWETIPKVYRRLNNIFVKNMGKSLPKNFNPIEFGSWMGGDRDGNPNVTAEVTKEVILLSRWEAAKLYEKSLTKLIRSYSMGKCSKEIKKKTGESFEPYRVYLRPLRDKMRITHRSIEQHLVYNKPLNEQILLNSREEILKPLRVVRKSLEENQNENLASGELLDLMRRAKCFGINLARLDIRQESSRHSQLIAEYIKRKYQQNYYKWSEKKKIKFLANQIKKKRNLLTNFEFKNKENKEVWSTFKTISKQPDECLGAYVISMTSSISDIVTVSFLQKEAQIKNKLRVVPLFETLDDLINSKAIMNSLFQEKWYRKLINNKQEVMIGYSDSSKDAGKICASWHQYKAQEEIVKLAKKFKIDVTFFHGRGGSAGRGGGPIQATLRSQPPYSVNGKIRITDQGEVIQQKYGYEPLAKYNLCSYIGAVTEATLNPPPAPKKNWRDLIEKMSDISKSSYRKNINQNSDFIRYFKTVTPHVSLGKLLIGSRPSKRKNVDNIKSLRAIPWVFAWTQIRLMLPAWLGSAEALRYSSIKKFKSTLLDMEKNWPFFNSMLDILDMVISKVDPEISKVYEKYLADHKLIRIGKKLRYQFETIKKLNKKITPKEIINARKQFRNIIVARNIYTEVLNVIQPIVISKLKITKGKENKKNLNDALLTSIAGISAAMKNTG